MFWGIYGALVVVALLFGLGNQQIISTVLSGGQKLDAGPLPVSAGQGDNAQLQARDSLIAAAEPGSRNPFVAVPAPKPPPKEVVKKPPPRRVEEPPPSLRALMFDTVKPSVQLRIGDSRSGWMHEGDEFHGWKVTEITESSVTVEKRGRTVLLGS